MRPHRRMPARKEELRQRAGNQLHLSWDSVRFGRKLQSSSFRPTINRQCVLDWRKRHKFRKYNRSRKKRKGEICLTNVPLLILRLIDIRHVRATLLPIPHQTEHRESKGRPGRPRRSRCKGSTTLSYVIHVPCAVACMRNCGWRHGADSQTQVTQISGSNGHRCLTTP
jgi:hypothetical protein